MAYPPETKSAALDLLTNGHAPKEVSSKLDVPLPTVYAWRKLLVRPKCLTPAIRREVVNRWEAGDSVRWLARRYGISTSTIYNWAKKEL